MRGETFIRHRAGRRAPGGDVVVRITVGSAVRDRHWHRHGRGDAFILVCAVLLHEGREGHGSRALYHVAPRPTGWRRDPCEKRSRYGIDLRGGPPDRSGDIGFRHDLQTRIHRAYRTGRSWPLATLGAPRPRAPDARDAE